MSNATAAPAAHGALLVLADLIDAEFVAEAVDGPAGADEATASTLGALTWLRVVLGDLSARQGAKALAEHQDAGDAGWVAGYVLASREASAE